MLTRKQLVAAVTVLLLTTSVMPYSYAQVVKMKPKIIRDLQNYSGPQADQNKPWNFFDSYNVIDPKNGITSFPASSRGDLTQALPLKVYTSYYPSGRVNDLYYPGNRGGRLVFDMTGAMDMNDTINRVTLSNLYG